MTIQEIAGKRAEVELIKHAIDVSEELIAESTEGKILAGSKKELAAASEELGVMESALKALMVAEYEISGEKKFDGGQVKMSITVDYEADKAIEYAMEQKAAGVLKLSAAKFKKLAVLMKPDFVIIKDNVPKASLSGDLSEFLEVENGG